MRYPRHVLSLFVPLLVLACENQVTDPEAASLADNPLFKKCSSPPCGGGGGGPGDGTPADPAIAYLEGGNLKVMNEDGSNQTTVFTSSTTHLGATPSWSRDGRRLAFAVSEPENSIAWRLKTIDLDIVNGIPVGSLPTTQSPDQVFDFAWSPTANIIAFAGGCGSDEPDGRCGDGDTQYLITVPADGSMDTTVVYEAPAGESPSYPTWNSDGSKIAFTTGRDGFNVLRILTLADAPTQNAPPLIDEGDFYWISFPAWSRDGTRIAFRGMETSESDPAVYIVDATSGLPREPVLSQPYYLGSFSWSPDDSKLVVDLDRAIRLVDPASGQVIPKRKSYLARGHCPNWRR